MIVLCHKYRLSVLFCGLWVGGWGLGQWGVSRVEGTETERVGGCGVLGDSLWPWGWGLRLWGPDVGSPPKRVSTKTLPTPNPQTNPTPGKQKTLQAHQYKGPLNRKKKGTRSHAPHSRLLCTGASTQNRTILSLPHATLSNVR